ncbi:MAG TPA: DUF1667 domain-containing protein [Candidatus Coprovicinus avistercoris]|uniref:DUF1667 domain-containing protein n=1 Tax=Candidatus Coprovicinus avistercoris TaxID=2840754 RepID=A0A9D1HYQ6_9ACTN|nr:DUF1667 domain-containing protein [Candidatus Coprovicinus avistercoris]
MEHFYTCIVCPRSCRITVTETNEGLEISGQGCKRGKAYVEAEYTHPERTITTTVALNNSHARRLPVVSSGPVPKEMLTPCLNEIYQLKVIAPITKGQVLITNLLNTGVDIIAAAPASSLSSQ